MHLEEHTGYSWIFFFIIPEEDIQLLGHVRCFGKLVKEGPVHLSEV